MPGGGDWQTIWPDGLDLLAHYILETADRRLDRGAVRGRAPGVRRRCWRALARGEAVDRAEYYFRTYMRFVTGAPALARLNRILAIGVGAREPGRVLLRVLEVL